MAKKMPGRLVALSASAVATIYVAGLVSTRSAADSAVAASVATETPALASTTATSTATSAPTVVVGASSPTASPTATASTYADGTYSATGTSRFGNVSVSVTIAGGTITNVQITKVSTTFPVSQIASLPAQVVQNQSANVNVVSGATYSAQAFKQAVQQALAQAVKS